MTQGTLKIERYAGALGAIVHGVNLAEIDDELFAEIHAAWLEYSVLFFYDQTLTPAQHEALGRRFGDELEKLPFLTTHADNEWVQVNGANPKYKPELFVDWHTDVTWLENPTLATVLYCVETPVGLGDTLWADMHAAYESLSEPLQLFLTTLTGVHDPFNGRQISMLESMGAEAYAAARKAMPLVEHPLIVRHPETDKPILYVNPLFLSHIKELERGESEALLNFLYTLSAKAEFQARLKWRPGTVAIWDNRCTMHKVVNDFWPRKRLMHRVAVHSGRRPLRH